MSDEAKRFRHGAVILMRIQAPFHRELSDCRTPGVRIPVMPDGYSNLKPDRYSNLMPDTIPI
jgi:hypothetical protein